MISAIKIRNDLNFKICSETIRRVLKSCVHIILEKLNNAPQLTVHHKVKGLKFTRKKHKQRLEQGKIFFYMYILTEMSPLSQICLHSNFRCIIDVIFIMYG